MPDAPKVRQYACPGCAAAVVFEPKDGALVCPYCGRKEEIPSSQDQVVERSYEDYLRARPESLARFTDHAQEASCQRCGSAIVFEPPDVAGACPFCGSSAVAQPKSADPLIAPQALLPFAVAKKKATEAVGAWIRSRWFLPSALKRIYRQDSIQGVYLPFWTFDAHTTTHYTGERGEYYYETETYTETDAQGRTVTRTRQVRRTRWYPASGTVSRWFDDLLIAATKSLPRNRLDALEPWDLAALQNYDQAFLPGFKAQRYQVGVAEGFELAKDAMAPQILADIRADIGGDEQRIHHRATSYTGITFKHLLLPVWISSYTFQKKVYQVMVNARTCEVQGDRPWSAWKIAGLVALIALVALVIALLKNG
jgi:uncharacterized Zn finger protein (UPF0148 family)